MRKPRHRKIEGVTVSGRTGSHPGSLILTLDSFKISSSLLDLCLHTFKNYVRKRKILISPKVLKDKRAPLYLPDRNHKTHDVLLHENLLHINEDEVKPVPPREMKRLHTTFLRSSLLPVGKGLYTL